MKKRYLVFLLLLGVMSPTFNNVQSMKKSDKPEVIDLTGDERVETIFGLKNLGNTCYFNSVLQSILSMGVDLEDLLPDDHLLMELFQNGEKVFEPRVLYDYFIAQNESFTKYRQEDAHEALTAIFNSIPGQGLFTLGVSDVFTCPACGPEFSTFVSDSTSCLTLSTFRRDFRTVFDEKDDKKFIEEQEIRRLGSLGLCLDEYFLRDERVERRCNVPACQNPICEKRTLIRSLPKYLFMSLNRFMSFQIVDQGGNLVDRVDRKVKHPVSIPKALDLERYCFHGVQGSTKYLLKSVIFHAGETKNSGHYFAVRRAESGDCFLCNDSHIVQLSGDEITQISRSGGYKGAHAYILVFEQVDADMYVPEGYFVDDVDSREYVDHLEELDPESILIEKKSLWDRVKSFFVG